jgi:hypothetical protein
VLAASAGPLAPGASAASFRLVLRSWPSVDYRSVPDNLGIDMFKQVGEALAGADVGEAGLRVALAVAAASYGVSLAESVTAAAIARAAGIEDARADVILRETLAALAAKPQG